MRTLATLLFGAYFIAPTTAQMIPLYDPEKYCDELAAFGGTRSESTYAGCISMEQSSYDALSPVWSRLHHEIRHYCDELARFGSYASYSTLEGCVKMELDAKSENRKFQF